MMTANLVIKTSDHLRRILEGVRGTKVLLLDSQTLRIVSNAISLSEILQKEVFLVERLETLEAGSYEHLKAICFIRPTTDSLLHFVDLLKEQERHNDDSKNTSGDSLLHKMDERKKEYLEKKCSKKFKEIHLFFTNFLNDQINVLKRLATLDNKAKIIQVCEYYIDINVYGPRIFDLGVASVSSLVVQPATLWTLYDEGNFTRMVQGCISILALMTRQKLYKNVKAGGTKLLKISCIRYWSESSICKRLAEAVSEKIFELHDVFPKELYSHTMDNDSECGLVMLIVDRREDPVSPLLCQWTYQAMLHELIGIENNCVKLKNSKFERENCQIVMNPNIDSFYKNKIFMNFGDLGISVREYLNEYQKKTHTSESIDSIEEMQQLVADFPDYKILAGNVWKHVTVLHELSRIVRERKLFDISASEQDFTCNESRSRHRQILTDVLEDKLVHNYDKLRLLILYALRYEGDPSVQDLKEELKTCGVSADEMNLVDACLYYAGTAVRKNDIFSNKNFFSIAKNSIQRGIKGSTNVYTQHRSHLSYNVEQLLKGKLCGKTYPVLFVDPNIPYDETRFYASTTSRKRPQQVAVFVVGGCTYGEYRDITFLDMTSLVQKGASTVIDVTADMINNSIKTSNFDKKQSQKAEVSTSQESSMGAKVVLGGTTIHNSKSFLADVSQMIKGHTLHTAISMPFGWGDF